MLLISLIRLMYDAVKSVLDTLLEELASFVPRLMTTMS